jgi:fluoroacetyl-CoA thioesterase
MSLAEIRPGLVGEKTLVVTEERTAKHIGSGGLRVLATPAMAMLIERTCLELVEPMLPEGQSTVGSGISVRHLGPTPLGMTVRARVEVTAVEDRQITFRAEVWDDVEKVGEGEHRRVVIDMDRFLRRIRSKRAAQESGTAKA